MQLFQIKYSDLQSTRQKRFEHGARACLIDALGGDRSAVVVHLYELADLARRFIKVRMLKDDDMDKEDSRAWLKKRRLF